jgi:hypothetical protein
MVASVMHALLIQMVSFYFLRKKKLISFVDVTRDEPSSQNLLSGVLIVKQPIPIPIRTQTLGSLANSFYNLLHFTALAQIEISCPQIQ